MSRNTFAFFLTFRYQSSNNYIFFLISLFYLPACLNKTGLPDRNSIYGNGLATNRKKAHATSEAQRSANHLSGNSGDRWLWWLQVNFHPPSRSSFRYILISVDSRQNFDSICPRVILGFSLSQWSNVNIFVAQRIGNKTTTYHSI